MPIDLKWVRSDPDQVRKWQNLRRRRVVATPKSGDSSVKGLDYNKNGDDDETVSIDLVDAVIRKDELSRQNLKNLQEHKKCLKQLQVRLRPKTTRQPVKKNEGDSDETKLAKAIEEGDGQENPEDQKGQEILPQSPPTSREDLLNEKKEIETKIRLAETDWKASLDDTQKALCKLASPVTISTNPNGNGDDCGDSHTDAHNLEATNVVVTQCLLPFSGHPRSSLGMDLEEAWRHYTLRKFASYLWVEVPRGVPVVEKSSNASQPSHFTSIDVDRAHELWGPICGVSSSSSSSSSSSQADHHPVAMLPSWIRLLTESLPSKSIWGEKELPRYTAIWSGFENNRTLPQRSENIVWLGRPKDSNNVESGEEDAVGGLPGASSISRPFSLEIVALMAPSVVDAREIQNRLVEELWNYYGDLLMVRGEESNRNKVLKRIVVAPPDLHNHEWSRIEIHVRMDSLSSSSPPSNGDAEEEGNESRTSGSTMDTLRLGWVSHWGDAATRACDMSFAGGGVVQAGGKKKKNKSTRNASTKEYVHLVEASVVDNSSSTWNKILYANTNSNDSANDADQSKQKEKQFLLDVPPVLAPYLVRPIPNPSSVPLEDLFVNENSKRKKKEAVFGVRGETKDSSRGRNEKQEPVNPCNSSRVGMATRDKPIFPPVGVTSSMSQEELQKRIRLEKLSCPYDFLFE